LPRHLGGRDSDAFIDKFLDVLCRADLSCRRSFYTSKRDRRGSRLGQAHHPGLCLHRRSARCIRARAFPRPEFVQNMVPSWMPAHWFWAYFVGCALLAAATSLTVRKFVRWSSALLGLMFFLFVCMIYIPYALAHPNDRFAWAYALRDLSFAGGAWALAGLHSRASSPQQSKWMILFGRIVIAIAAIFYAVEHFLHPEFAPGVPLEKMTPSWVPFPSVWGYLAGAILLAAGIGLALNKQSRIAAASIGALMTVLTLFLYLPYFDPRPGRTDRRDQ
jgi:uncharacterized membrane protein